MAIDLPKKNVERIYIVDSKCVECHFVFVFTMNDLAEPYINKGVPFPAFSFSDNGNVVLAVTSCHAFAVNALHEHPLASALYHLEILDFVFQRDLPHYFAALAFHFLWHLVGHRGGFGAGAHRVFEGVDVAEPDFAGEVAAFLEGLFGLAWEAHDDVGGDVEVGACDLDALAHVAELGDSVKAVHALQGVVGAALKADVHVRSEFLVLEQGQKTVAELVRLNGGDAHTEVTVNV